MLAGFHAGRSNLVWQRVCGDESRFFIRRRSSSHHNGLLFAVHHPVSWKVKVVPRKNDSRFCGKKWLCCDNTLATQLTVTVECYTSQYLPQVLAAIAERQPRTPHWGILLHHDNAPTHRTKPTQGFLEQQRAQQVEHPPYSPQLASCDFFVFPHV